MKLWDKGYSTHQMVEQFTVGNDRVLDLYLAPFDVLGSMAHVNMLQSINLISKEECKIVLKELKNIYNSALKGDFTIDDGIEDVHSQVEMLLVKRIGEAGKKIHSARSRNDQVLVDLKLFTRNKLEEVVNETSQLFTLLLNKSEQFKKFLLPGYTHMQVAMPSSFGLWFGAFAESLSDDLLMLKAAFDMANQNPLGSAAGYGSSFPINRTLTTQLLGFEHLNVNVVYAQMGRGKTEKNVAFALSAVASTLAKLAADACLFNSQNFGFIKIPKEYTTGSSIMPHKTNPDVFELIRARCNKLQALPNELALITNNLTSGYFRDYQILKEAYLPAFDTLIDCIKITRFIIEGLEVNEHILDNDSKYDYLFSVEEVNRKVLQGIPFRDAYKEVGQAIMENNYSPNKQIQHTHEGSIGNLCNHLIREKFETVLKQFPFEHIKQKLDELINEGEQ